MPYLCGNNKNTLADALLANILSGSLKCESHSWSIDVKMVELSQPVASGPPPRGNIKNIRAAWERAACHNSRITKIILSRSYKIIYTSATR